MAQGSIKGGGPGGGAASALPRRTPGVRRLVAPRFCLCLLVGTLMALVVYMYSELRHYKQHSTTTIATTTPASSRPCPAAAGTPPLDTPSVPTAPTKTSAAAPSRAGGAQEQVSLQSGNPRFIHGKPVVAGKLDVARARAAVARLDKSLLAGEQGAARSALPAGMQMPPSTERLIVGYCDDGMQNFARDVARHILPWKGSELVYVPELGYKMEHRGVTDTTYINENTTPEEGESKRVSAEGNAESHPACRDPRQGDHCITVPHVLICTGWNYRKELKKMHRDLLISPAAKRRTAKLGGSTALAKALGVPKGETIDGSWIDGVYYPQGLGLPRHRSGERPFIIANNDEAWATNSAADFDLMLDSKVEVANVATDIPTIYTPVAMLNWWRSVHTVYEAMHSRPLAAEREAGARMALASKTKFCAFMYNRCWRADFSHADAVLRVALYDILHDMLQEREASDAGTSTGARTVNALGYCRKQADDAHDYPFDKYQKGRTRQSYMDAAVMEYHAYKFVITSENTIMPGYVTEKMVNSILAHTVPIYIGASDIEGIVDARRFVHCVTPPEAMEELRQVHGSETLYTAPEDKPDRENPALVRWVRAHPVLGANLKKCAARAIALDHDDKRYIAMLSHPPVATETEYDHTVWSPRYYGERIRQVLTVMGSDLLDTPA